VNKTLTKKLIYVITVLALLAMMIPAFAVPVMAAPGLTMYLIDPLDGSTTVSESSPGFNVFGSQVLVTATGLGNLTVLYWSIPPSSIAPLSGAAEIVSVSSDNTSVIAQGTWGNATIQAHLSNGTTLSIEKKWGQIESTSIDNIGGFSPVTWQESTKEWTGTATITDNVTGAFYEKDALTHPVDPARPNVLFHSAAGVILNWYLVAGNVTVPMASGKDIDLNPIMANLAKPNHVTFAGQGVDPGPYHLQTVTPASGSVSVTLDATGEEAVQIVVIPTYPFGMGGVNIDVTPEITTYDFYTTEMEVVPQVRWVGEKIVLEKNFGEGFEGWWVKYSLQNQSVGHLESIDDGTNQNQTSSDSIWTTVDSAGFSSVILVSTDPGVADVTASLYRSETDDLMVNQHFFTVYYLKFESLTLGDVYGKREFHNDGPWQTLNEDQPTNPWDPTGSYNGAVNPVIADNMTQTLNVSQDALLRAQVKGWFLSSNPTTRDEGVIPGTNLLLPAHRWVLPDDWAALAGPNWKTSRMHWDIMCNPDGSVGSESNVLGDYRMPPITGKVVGAYEVIGPFSPGLELMTPLGWTIPNPNYDAGGPRDGMNTVVPDGKLNPWDAPMPPAKIIFQIQGMDANGEDLASTDMAGYFKATNKADVYYIMVGGTTVYTNPFYEEMIPAHPYLSNIAFINNGGYDWDSFDESYGPYMFWEFINQHNAMPLVPTTDPAGHPTSVEVYSDNHGEAMVWLNGNWNLDLSSFLSEGSTADIPMGEQVGMTTIQATADYPYARVHQAIQSNLDTKTWLWGGQILGTDEHTFALSTGHSTNMVDTRMVLSVGNFDDSTRAGTRPNEVAKSSEKMVWVWVTDRDGLPDGVLDAKVVWNVATNTGSTIRISQSSGQGISNYNPVTQNIWLDNGFLADTHGIITDGANRQNGISYLRMPTDTEKELFLKFWGTGGTSAITDLNPDDYVVAAIKVTGGEGNYTSKAMVNIDIFSHDFDIMMGQSTPGMLSYETDIDLFVKDALDDGITAGDANCDGKVNMGDVTAVERMILGYDAVTSNAIVNEDRTVDMGTVVKIERTILGLN
jgi:hypothetical protein